MAAPTPTKTAVEAANKQLEGMYMKLVEQERSFKEILAEKEQEIVRLHEALEEQEKRFKQQIQQEEQKAKTDKAELESSHAAKEREVTVLRQTLDQIVSLATTAGFDSMVGDAGELFSQEATSTVEKKYTIVDDELY